MKDKESRGRLTIRYAKPEEMSEVWRLDRNNLSENWNMFPATDRPLKPAELVKQHRDVIARWYVPAKHKIVIAKRDGKILGMIWYTVENDLLFQVKLGFLFSIVVHPDHRQEGLGRRMLREFKNRVKRAGAKYVRLAVLHNNVKATNLYRQEGFFDDTHYMLARLEPTGPEKRKAEAKKKKTVRKQAS